MQSESRKEASVVSDEPPQVSSSTESLSIHQGETPLKLDTLKASQCWNDWRWQMRNRIRTVPQLMRLFPELASSEQLTKVADRYPMAITPYYASLIQHFDMSDPVFQMSVPQMDELFDPPFLHADPLEEEEDTPVPGLVHRYPDRALVMATTQCSMYCRHCTRKRVAGTRETAITAAQLKSITAYLHANPRITDVIISGGDPFTLPMDVLERILIAIRSVPSVEIIRIGTRTPVVMPMRITDELTDMLKKYHPLWVNTHFNHPEELTPDAVQACERLVNAGIPMGNQTVLLHGINDNPLVMEKLFRGLVKMRVRPYYLFQCDLVRGIEHFRTPISRGLEIMEYLRGRLSGLAIPSYVVDAPHGGGKIPLLPNYMVSVSPSHTVLRNYEGMIVNYPEPAANLPAASHVPKHDVTPGVWELSSGRRSAIMPASSNRDLRRNTRREKKAARPAPPSRSPNPCGSVQMTMSLDVMD